MLSSLVNNLKSYTESLIDKYHIPAVSIAVWHERHHYQAAAGLLNLDTGVEATETSIFQIGSITKVFTASLVMQLVDAGRVDLDKPVKQYLREFQVADPESTQTITVRQLLNHTSGIAGDFFPDDLSATGNPIARYVDRCNLLPQVHAPGQHFSYSNAAYAIAGRLVEVMMGMSWFEAVEEKIYQPLGMTNAIAHPINALRYRAAMGHFPQEKDPTQWALSPTCYFCMGTSPGGRLSMSASDLITFAKVHLNNGKAESGLQWLSADSIRLMQTPTVALPPSSNFFDTHWGLGWGVSVGKRSNRTMISHSGQTAGQHSVLRLFPDQDTAFAVLLNGVKAGVADGIVNDLMSELIGIDDKEPEPEPNLLSAEQLLHYTGTFDGFDAVYKVEVGHAGEALERGRSLTASCTDKLDKTVSQYSWRPLGGQLFASYTLQGIRMANITFIKEANASIPNALFVGGRLSHRLVSSG